MLKSVLMAASGLPASQIPTPRHPQYVSSPLNIELANTLNQVLMRMRRFVEILMHSRRIAPGSMRATTFRASG
jgi:hypothetical protein